MISSLLWSLLYLAPLLALTAAVFAWFGWRWRGADQRRALQELQARLDERQKAHAEEADTLKSLRSQAEDLQTRLDSASHALSMAQAEREEISARLAATQAELAALHARPPAQPAPELPFDPQPPAEKPRRKRPATTATARTGAQHPPAAAADGPEDDLTRIKGIKGITSERLREQGIRTWRQIALWSGEELGEINKRLSLKNRPTRERWQEQARALHEAAHGPLS